jgi:glycosyltransferase involved in cell wall biosynthesis
MLMREGGLRLGGIMKAGSPGNPLVSIVTVVYNGEKHIEQTIRSILEQSYRPIEYIVVDGGSTDGTIDIVSKYEDRIDYWISEPDKGISDAMNKGILLSTGELIAHLHADDYYADPSVVSSICSEYLRHPGALWLTGGINIVAREGNLLEEIRARKYSYKRLIRGNILLHPATFVTRQAFEKAGAFDAGYRYAMDYDLWLRLGAIADPVVLDLQVAASGLMANPAPSPVGTAYDESWRIGEKHLSGIRKDLATTVLLAANASSAHTIKPVIEPSFLRWNRNSNSRSPLVSVIVATYNRPDRLTECLRSILGQTYPNIEMPS